MRCLGKIKQSKIKFIYNSQSEMNARFNNNSIKLLVSNCEIKDIIKNTILTESTNKFKIKQYETYAKFQNFALEDGKEYLLVFDIIFSSDSNLTSFNTIVDFYSFSKDLLYDTRYVREEIMRGETGYSIRFSYDAQGKYYEVKKNSDAEKKYIKGTFDIIMILKIHLYFLIQMEL
ncbi:hypothetical protein JYG23_00780 [Sedimentibacter sp. zth1]|uniref:hypothetical protein n=1 Tax=Sedimentibacter sp. zth1 TaxID=2816908 RepID=UPI001A9195A6|nr:hypothetical protein [Sedimentibacter sp. zth1]QSX06034.1 hypothetical protein JYG23_00780 [Sedimentibacter sp. zth1]